MNFLCSNGEILPVSHPVLLAENRGYRYGDGIFETIRVVEGKLQLRDQHFTRLFHSIKLLEYTLDKSFTAGKLERQVLDLCEKNNCLSSARVRLSVYSGHGNIYDKTQAGYLIEASPLDLSAFPGKVEIEVAPGILKHADNYSHLKSTSALCYSLAARYAVNNGLDDCILLNQFGRIADSSIANVFVINQDGSILTPPLSEGCVDGTMRKYLIENLKLKGKMVTEAPLPVSLLISAREIFLTNAIRMVTPVFKFGNRSYDIILSKEISDSLKTNAV